MATVIQTIKDKFTGNIIYPRTTTKAITTTDGELIEDKLISTDTKIENIEKTPTILVTANKTLDLSDLNTVQKCLSASVITITIPLNIFPINTEIVIVRDGTGAVTINGITNVTLHSAREKRDIKDQYGAVTLKQIALNDWRIYGSLE
ncbi:hypothetical protein [Sinanaerobacter chloroacetimidivorans]|uniref:Uncharacterized protein n=1 Tax=Sinanaerobacter chloroacetimidivorans TaxID=2818044 RepID=A0A8J7W0H1_9FIRM|nr:hypothetical protein [Sinanaerobacter chloroacetimidivorans]MBR0596973.1 hypothetical protein [Sinanaerobacter chloroacetimidivorans]